MIYNTTYRYIFYNIFLRPKKYPGGIRIQIRNSGFMDLRIQIQKSYRWIDNTAGIVEFRSLDIGDWQTD